jgi:hypothetical protein
MRQATFIFPYNFHLAVPRQILSSISFRQILYYMQNTSGRNYITMLVIGPIPVAMPYMVLHCSNTGLAQSMVSCPRLCTLFCAESVLKCTDSTANELIMVNKRITDIAKFKNLTQCQINL